MSEVLNPVDIENQIKDIADRVTKGVKIVSDAYADFLKADREYDRAYAMAYRDFDGPAHEKKPAAELATFSVRENRDDKDVAYRYADRLAKALELELRALQSIGASVRSMYSVAGRGA